ncbi:MAG: hypothetical protein WCI75_16910, partial [candidate division NC10 bacterium]
MNRKARKERKENNMPDISPQSSQSAQRKTRYFHPWSEARSTDPGSLCGLCELCGENSGLSP